MKDYDCDEESDSEEHCTIEIAPPVEDCTAMTDCDSDKSVNEVTCNPDHLPWCILFYEVIANKKKNKSVAATFPDKTNDNAPRNPKCTKKSRKNPLPVWNNRIPDEYNGIIPDFHNNNFTKQRVLDPIQCLNRFWTEESFENICYQRKLYALQKSLPSECITPDNLRVFLALTCYLVTTYFITDECTGKLQMTAIIPWLRSQWGGIHSITLCVFYILPITWK